MNCSLRRKNTSFIYLISIYFFIFIVPFLCITHNDGVANDKEVQEIEASINGGDFYIHFKQGVESTIDFWNSKTLTYGMLEEDLYYKNEDLLLGPKLINPKIGLFHPEGMTTGALYSNSHLNYSYTSFPLAEFDVDWNNSIRNGSDYSKSYVMFTGFSPISSPVIMNYLNITLSVLEGVLGASNCDKLRKIYPKVVQETLKDLKQIENIEKKIQDARTIVAITQALLETHELYWVMSPGSPNYDFTNIISLLNKCDNILDKTENTVFEPEPSTMLEAFKTTYEDQFPILSQIIEIWKASSAKDRKSFVNAIKKLTLTQLIKVACDAYEGRVELDVTITKTEITEFVDYLIESPTRFAYYSEWHKFEKIFISLRPSDFQRAVDSLKDLRKYIDLTLKSYVKIVELAKALKGDWSSITAADHEKILAFGQICMEKAIRLTVEEADKFIVSAISSLVKLWVPGKNVMVALKSANSLGGMAWDAFTAPRVVPVAIEYNASNESTDIFMPFGAQIVKYSYLKADEKDVNDGSGFDYSKKFIHCEKDICDDDYYWNINNRSSSLVSEGVKYYYSLQTGIYGNDTIDIEKKFNDMLHLRSDPVSVQLMVYKFTENSKEALYEDRKKLFNDEAFWSFTFKDDWYVFGDDIGKYIKTVEKSPDKYEFEVEPYNREDSEFNKFVYIDFMDLFDDIKNFFGRQKRYIYHKTPGIYDIQPITKFNAPEGSKAFFRDENGKQVSSEFSSSHKMFVANSLNILDRELLLDSIKINSDYSCTYRPCRYFEFFNIYIPYPINVAYVVEEDNKVINFEYLGRALPGTELYVPIKEEVFNASGRGINKNISFLFYDDIVSTYTSYQGYDGKLLGQELINISRKGENDTFDSKVVQAIEGEKIAKSLDAIQYESENAFIFGMIQDQHGNTIDNATVELYQTDGQNTELIAKSLSDENGRYLFYNNIINDGIFYIVGNSDGCIPYNGVNDHFEVSQGQSTEKNIILISDTSVPIFGQGQQGQEWSIDQLGTCSLTMATHGCAVTSIAMILKYYGVDTDPGDLNEWLKQNNGYVDGCLVKWGVAAGRSNGTVDWIGRYDYKVIPADLDKINAELDKGYPVIAEVRLSGYQHFVVITSRSGSTYYINDPWYGDQSTINERYGSDPARAIYGIRVYHGTPSITLPLPIPQPDPEIPIRFSDDSTIYYYSNGYYWPIQDADTYGLLGFGQPECSINIEPDYSYIKDVDVSEKSDYERYLKDKTVPTQGIAVKITDKIGPINCIPMDTETDPSITYIFDCDRFRPVANDKALSDLGFSSSDIAHITQGLFDEYGEGDVIKEGSQLYCGDNHLPTPWPDPIFIKTVGDRPDGKIKIFSTQSPAGGLGSNGTIKVAGAEVPSEWTDDGVYADIFSAVGFTWDMFSAPVHVEAFDENGQLIGDNYYPFSDVQYDDWYVRPVMKLWKENIISGHASRQSNTFWPNVQAIRSEYLTVAVTSDEQANDPDRSYPSYTGTFLDVASGDWFADYVQFGTDNGIIQGCDSEKTRFCPQNLVNRAEAVKITTSIFDKYQSSIDGYLQGDTPDFPFSDVADAGAWFYPYVYAAKDGRLISGYRDGSFRPGQFITRAEMAKINCIAAFGEKDCMFAGEQDMPIVSAVRPSTATLNQESVYTVYGRNLPESTALWIDECADMRPLSGGTPEKREFKCTPGFSAGEKKGQVKDRTGGVMLYEFKVIVEEEPVDPPVVTSVTPTTATFEQETVFTVTGTNLPETTAFWIGDCANLQSLGGTSTQRQFSCTPSYSTGTKDGLVKDQTEGTELFNFTIQVVESGSTTPVVTSVTPTTVTFEQETTFTVYGSNLPDTTAFWIGDCAYLESLGGTSTQRQFRCTPSYSTGTKDGLVKDQTEGTELFNFTIQVQEQSSPTIEVFSVSPTSVEIDKSTTFTVTGSNLPDTTAFFIEECAYLVDLGGNSTERSYRCTPSYSPGTKSGVVKDRSGGTELYNFTVNVALGTPTVSEVSPTSATLNVPTTFYVKGTSLSADIAFWIGDCADVIESGGTAEEWRFECTPSYSTGIKDGVVKDRPGGTELKAFSVNVTQ